MKHKKLIAAALAALLLLGGCTKNKATDPYEGMVQVESGFGHKMWVQLIEELPKNPLTEEQFSEGRYIGGDFTVRNGIDVSEHQGVIDWMAVAEEGVDFAIIRVGYRGYSEGGLFEDDYFHDNIVGAMQNGIDVGLYFFSQAITAEEAIEEANFLLEHISSYGPEDIALPIFYDWESIETDDARTDELDGTTLTDCAIAFTGTIAAAGYTPGVYAYRNLGYFSYDLLRLSHLEWWMAALNDYPDFYYAHKYWQYSITGSVAGIEGEVDKNMMFIPVEAEAAAEGTE